MVRVELQHCAIDVGVVYYVDRTRGARLAATRERNSRAWESGGMEI
jgi:hypothetical protein